MFAAKHYNLRHKMKNLTSWFLPNLIDTMRINIANSIPFDSDYQLWGDILTNRYVVEVEQFGVIEQYSTSNCNEALEFIETFDRENKDIIIRTYDLTTYSYEGSCFEPIF